MSLPVSCDIVEVLGSIFREMPNLYVFPSPTFDLTDGRVYYYSSAGAYVRCLQCPRLKQRTHANALNLSGSRCGLRLHLVRRDVRAVVYVADTSSHWHPDL